MTPSNDGQVLSGESVKPKYVRESKAEREIRAYALAWGVIYPPATEDNPHPTLSKAGA